MVTNFNKILADWLCNIPSYSYGPGSRMRLLYAVIVSIIQHLTYLIIEL